MTFVLNHVGDGVSLPAAVDAALVAAAPRPGHAASHRGPSAPPPATRSLALYSTRCRTTPAACAILAVAFASGGRRRSEVVALRLADVTPAGRDYTLRIRRSKTDQRGEGVDGPVKRGAADALRRWLWLLAEQGITKGPLFREMSRRGKVGAEAVNAPPRPPASTLPPMPRTRCARAS